MSQEALELLYRVNELGMLLWAEPDGAGSHKLRYSLYRELPEKAEWLAKLKPQKQALLDILIEAGVTRDGIPLPILYPLARERAPLSYAQRRLWFLDRFEEGTGAYNIPILLAFEAGAQAEPVRQSLQAILERHTVLRSRIVSEGRESYLTFQAADTLSFELRELPSQQAFEDDLREEIERPFDLEQELPIRACWYTVADGEPHLLINLHHIAFDGWSLDCFLAEFDALYRQHDGGETAELPALPIQYHDFAHWQQRSMQQPLIEEQVRYWREKLSGVARLELPLDHPRPPRIDYHGQTLRHGLTPSLSKALRELARQESVSTYSLLLAAWSALLARYSGQEDIVCGTPVANRHYPGTRDLIGFFVNSLALRNTATKDLRFRDFLQAVHRGVLEAQQHQDLPFDRLVEKLELPRDTSCHPIFQVFFALQQASEAQESSESPFRLCRPEDVYQVAKYDLSLFVNEGSETLELELNYATALFDEALPAQLLAHCERLLTAIAADPAQALGAIELLDERERKRLIFEENETFLELPPQNSVTELFDAQVPSTPDALALRFEERELSYAQMDARSNALANRLRELGAGPEQMVGLYLERSLELIVAIVAIHKCGAAYLPIAPEFPAERSAFILEESQAPVLISQRRFEEELKALDYSGRTLWLDTPEDCGEDESPSSERPTGEQLAYVIYTSGTTGRPKGVQLEHRNLFNRIDWMQRSYPIGPGDRILQKTPYIFDVSVWELTWAQSYGAAVVLAKPEGHKDPDYLWQLIEAEQITVLHFVPTMFQAFLDDLELRGRKVPACLRYLFCSGEALPLSSVEQFHRLNQGCELHNLYGPTETAIDSSFFACPAGIQRVPIGRPIQNTQLYILDEQLRLVPPGVAGELYIAGDGVARGYLQREELTAERFLPNPFHHSTANARAGQRMYKTGDRVRMLSDGNIEYLGRNDFQVKLRGFRIELGEIEAALCQLEGVTQAIVMLRQESGRDYLAAWCQCDVLPAGNEIRAHLLASMPDYMVPEVFVGVETFPTTVNGKLDRRALPEPVLEQAGYAAPRNALEEALCTLWQESLNLEQVGIDDDFFRSGGNSILAIGLAHEMAQLLERDFPIARLFTEKTIRSISESQQTGGLTQIQRNEAQPAKLSFAQQRLWFLQQYDPSNSAYHIPMPMRLKEREPQRLEESLRALLERHAILRSYIGQEGGEACLLEQPAQAFQLQRRAVTSEALEAALQHSINRPFDLSRELPLRAELFEVDDCEEAVLLLNVHHIAFDGWSTPLFFAEFERLYRGSGELPDLPIRYRDYAAWQQGQFAAGQFDDQLDYWREQLAQLEPLSLPTDLPRPARIDYRGGNHLFELPTDLSQDLRTCASREGVSLYTLLLTGFTILLHKSTRQEDIVVGTPFANRDRPETRSLIGFFINTLPLRNRVETDAPWRSLLTQVETSVQQAQRNQDLPFEQLVDQLGLERDPSRHPVFQLLFSMHQFKEAPGTDWYEPVDLGTHYQVAKYDLSLYMSETGERLSGALNYAAALFEPAGMENFAKRYEALLRAMVRDCETSVDALAWFSTEDHARIEASRTPLVSNLQRHAFADCFYRASETHAQKTALHWGGEHWSYAELNARSNQLAHWLREEYGLARGELVCLLLERGPDLILSILAVLKAGGAYVPLAPDYPESRMAFILEDTGAKLVLTQRDLMDKLPVRREARLYPLDSLQHLSASQANLSVDIAPQDLAYVLYTSGTTGKPKGVIIEQGSFTDFLLNFPHGTEDVHFLSLTTYTFDIFGLEYGLPLLTGGALYLSDLGQASEDLAAHPAINLVQQTPSVLRTLLSLGFQGRAGLRCLVGGEALDTDLLGRLQEQFSRILNVYGPTETVIWSTWHDCSAESNPLHIGEPLPNEWVCVLDEQLEPLPPGVIGELFIGGAGVGRGYLNREALSAERFLPCPWDPQERLYRTGDLVRQRTDGGLEFVGRTDFQIKIRGHRIEIGEIEAALQAQTQVKQAVVVARQHEQLYLAAYYLAEHPIATDALNDHLSEQLPAYMLPEAYVHLEAFPLTANGKIDRKALPEPERTHTSYVAPQSELERQVAELWQEVLGIERVGLTDDFFRLGGNSIRALLLCHRMSELLGKRVPVAELFDHKCIAALLRQLESVSSQQIARLEGSEAPLSYAQSRLWFLHQLEPDSHAWHIPMLLRLQDVEHDCLQAALRSLLERQDVLRTQIVHVNGEARQCVRELEHWQLPTSTLSADALEGFVSEMSEQPFQLEEALPIRLHHLQLEDGEHLLLAVVHHIAFDGWSMDLLLEELEALYRSERWGEPHELAPLPIRYRDFSAWQRRWLAEGELERQLDWWQQQLDGIEPLDLPTDFSRPTSFETAGADYAFQIPAPLADNLRTLARERSVTLYTLLSASWALFLHKLTGQEDVVFGTPVANRHIQGSEGLIGFFVNTLAVRNRIDPQASFLDYLAEADEGSRQVQRHQDLPFEILVERLGLERDPSRHPLFQHLFSLQNFAGQAESSHWLSPHPLQAGSTQAKYDLSLLIEEDEQDFQAVLNYATSLFRPERIEAMAAHFTELLEQVAAQPNRPLGSYSLLNPARQQQVLALGRSDHPPHQRHRTTLLARFQEQVALHPEHIAVSCEDEHLSYAQLDAAAVRLAHALLEAGGPQQEVVALLLERSTDMAVAILAVLKVGAAWAPIEPGTPPKRIEHMLADTGARIALCQEHLLEKLSGVETACRLLALDAIEMSPTSKALPEPETQPDSLAYIIYTSGTTGQPKGVMVEHASVLNTLLQQQADYAIGPGSTLYLGLSYAFDAAVSVLMNSLCSGAHLLLSKELNFHAPCLSEVTHLFISGSVVEVLEPARFPKLERLIYGGSAADRRALERFRYCRIHTEYGVTEAAITSTSRELTELEQISIGRPFANTELYVLDAGGQLLPPGVVGELYIGGAGVARGYLNQPELSRERFQPNPWRPGERYYRSGDLACWDKAGQLHFHGRRDKQVKLRGHRIELSEIEGVLKAQPGIEQVVVLALEHGRSQQLAAWLVANHKIDEAILREACLQELPDYMVPASWIQLTSIPLTKNGKIDASALPEPNWQSTHRAASTQTEKAVAAIWQNLLDIDEPGLDDDFFHVGGDSILSMQLAARLHEQGWPVSVKAIFQHRSLGQLARHLDEQSSLAPIEAEQGQLSGHFDLLPIQQWFFALEAEGQLADRNHWNQSFLLRVPELELAALEAAIGALQCQHDLLRASFTQTATGWQQFYRPEPQAVPIVPLNCRELEEAQLVEALNALQAGFCLEESPLFAVAYLHGYEDGSARLAMIFHHLVVDAVSWRILAEDLRSLLTGGQLPPKTSSYRAWVEHRQEHGSHVDWDAHIDQLPKPSERPRQARHASSLEVDADTSEAVLQLAGKRYDCGEDTLLLTALARALRSVLGGERQAVLLENHGRPLDAEGIDLTRTVGWFTHCYPVNLHAGEDLGEALLDNRETLQALAAEGHGYLPALLRQPGQATRRQPECTFNYLGRFDSGEADWQLAGGFSGENTANGQQALERLNVLGFWREGQLHFALESDYGADCTEALAAAFKGELATLAAHAQKPEVQSYAVACPRALPDFRLLEVIQPEKPETVFILPPGEGNSESYQAALVPALSDRRLVLFNNFYRELLRRGDAQTSHLRFESLARLCLAHIRALQPAGPVHLLGWSFGGVLALEIARQLEAEGRSIGSLQLIDACLDLPRAMREHPPLDALLRQGDLEADINYNYRPHGRLKAAVTLYKADRLSQNCPHEALQALELAYLQSPDNYLGTHVDVLRIETCARGHFDPPTEPELIGEILDTLRGQRDTEPMLPA